MHADGSLNATCASLKTFGMFMAENGWLQRAHRSASVQIGYEWNTQRCDEYDLASLPLGGAKALILPVFPEIDVDYDPCTPLTDLLSGVEFAHQQPLGPAFVIEGVGRVFGIGRNISVCERLPEGAKPIATDACTDHIAGFEMPMAKACSSGSAALGKCPRSIRPA